MSGILTRDRRPWPIRRREALANAVMRTNVGRVTRRLSQAREHAYRDYARGREMRVRARLAKRQAILDLDDLLTRFSSVAQQHGVQVARAAGPDEAARYIVAVARRRGAQRVVKSKSMMTEELDLNRRLTDAGLSVRETDLGEYIIQLLEERPSHILAPAAHRNREEIYQLFRRTAKAAGVAAPASNDVGTLTAFARRQLRADFLSADIGISGANVLVAETGTVVLITNEGNADMVTSLAPVHIVVAGIEKLVATWDDLGAIIQQPALSGIGQRLSAYTTLITGPATDPDQLEGPEEVHVLLVDNGRRDLVGGPYEDVLACIRCGACYNVCPVYRQVGGHAYGSTYAGPIGAVETPLLAGVDFLPELATSLCTLCNACVEACPMGIELADHFITLRREKVEHGREAWSTGLTYRWWGRWWASPRRYRRFVSWARRGQPLVMGRGRLTRSPGLPGGWFWGRDMPPIAAETFHEWWARHRAHPADAREASQ